MDVIFDICSFNRRINEKLAIEMDFGYTYTGLFASNELIIYALRLFTGGMGASQILIHRLPAFFMHIITTFVQKHFYDKDVEQNSDHKGRFGYIIGVIIHAIFNGVAVITAI